MDDEPQTVMKIRLRKSKSRVVKDILSLVIMAAVVIAAAGAVVVFAMGIDGIIPESWRKSG